MPDDIARLSVAAILACGTMALLMSTEAAAQWLPNLGLFSRTCATDDEIPAEARSPIDQAALELAQAVVSSDPVEAYARLADELRGKQTPEAFATYVHNVVSIARFTNLRVSHTYLITTTEVTILGSGQSGTAFCSRLKGGNALTPAEQLAVAVKSVPEQAHVIVEADTFNNTFAFVIWLVPEHDQWRALALHVMATASVGKSAEDVWDLAREQQRRGHDLNSVILYAFALELANRGPAMQLGIQSQIQKDFAAARKPDRLKGEAPWVLQFGTRSFRILNFRVLGIAGKLYLTIRHEVPAWTDEQDPARQNRELIAEIPAAFPEYREVFAGLLIEAIEAHGTRLYRSHDDDSAKSSP